MKKENEETTSLKIRAIEKLRRDLGSEFLEAFHDPKTVEIMLNADGKLWLERLGEEMRCIGELPAGQAESIIKTIAGYHNQEVTRFKPTIEGEFPLDGSRFAGQLSPVVHAPTFAIRKRAVSIFTLEDYVESNIMTKNHFNVLKEAIANERNILIIGGTGSGKTTLVNSIIHEIVELNPNERVFIIEDTNEIQCSATNRVQYHTTNEVSMTMLLKTTLRMRPDRILVGEVRGPEALDLLMAWNTGHEGGVATLHANNAVAGLTRLAQLISMHPDSPKPIAPLIGEAVHFLVHISRTETGRRVQQIVEVQGYENGQYKLRHL